MWLWVSILIVAGLFTLHGGRQLRLRQMQRQAWQTLSFPAQESAGEYAALAGLSAVELYWQWSTINPDIIAAADFSSTHDIRSGLDFANYVHQQISGLDGAALAGFNNRLLGYVGEEKVSQLLQAQGHLVEVAQAANQPVWDLLVDGQAVNVKTVLDIAEIKAVALAHPDVIYLVPEDAQGVETNNIQRLADFNHDDLAANLGAAINQADTHDAVSDLASHLPVIPFAFSLFRNYQAVQQGRSSDVAMRHVVLDTLGKGGGAALGALVLGTVGSVAGPVGTLVGTTIGGLLGRYLGGELVDDIKKQPLRQAIEIFEKHLQQFGAVYIDRSQRVIHALYQPWQRQQAALNQLSQQLQQRQRRFWKRYWPDFRTVLLQQAVAYGQQQQDQQLPALKSLENQLSSASARHDYKPLALLMLNTPHLRELLGVDLLSLRYLELLRQRVYRERTELDPALFPPH